MVRFLMWRALSVFALLAAFALGEWFLDGGLGALLRPSAHRASPSSPADLVAGLARHAAALWWWAPIGGVAVARLAVLTLLAVACGVLLTRAIARRRRRYRRWWVLPYRTDRADAEALVRMVESLHARLRERPWRRLVLGQPSCALEVHYEPDPPAHRAWLAVSCPRGLEHLVESALRIAYPNCRLIPAARPLELPRALVRVRKRAPFIRRAKAIDRFEHMREPATNRLLAVMAAQHERACLQVALTPAPAFLEALAKRMHATAEERRGASSGERRAPAPRPTMAEHAELRGGLDLLHVPLFFTDLRVLASDRRCCRQIASELSAQGAENRLVERGGALCHLPQLYARRLDRGEGNPVPSPLKDVCAPSELAALWQFPSIDYAGVPLARSSVPVAPAPPAILRPGDGLGTLRDSLGPVSIDVELRRQNIAVPGTVEQGKSSFLVATVAEDLRRERCAVIVLDAKGDAADAAVSLVAPERTCTLLDFAHPTCGFNPLAVDAPADVIADYVVAALRNLFSDADIRASSDRYLRNAIIAVLAYERSSTLWDAARLLSVGEDGYAYRRRVAATVRGMPEFSERPNYFDVNVYGAAADTVGQYMRKGSRVGVDGRLEWREWETAESQKRQAVSIVADTVQFLDAPGEREESGQEDELVAAGAADSVPF